VLYLIHLQILFPRHLLSFQILLFNFLH
jgi:hypothetical protein